MRFLQSWLINTVAVLMAVIILRNHISYGEHIGLAEKALNLLATSFLLVILNAFVRPILMILALPLLIVTLGLFTLVINALLLALLTQLLPFFSIHDNYGQFSFGYAFLAALIISIISVFLNLITGNAKVTVQRRRPPQDPPKDSGGDGPVIDV